MTEQIIYKIIGIDKELIDKEIYNKQVNENKQLRLEISKINENTNLRLEIAEIKEQLDEQQIELDKLKNRHHSTTIKINHKKKYCRYEIE